MIVFRNNTYNFYVHYLKEMTKKRLLLKVTSTLSPNLHTYPFITILRYLRYVLLRSCYQLSSCNPFIISFFFDKRYPMAVIRKGRGYVKANNIFVHLYFFYWFCFYANINWRSPYIDTDIGNTSRFIKYKFQYASKKIFEYIRSLGEDPFANNIH